MNKVLTLIAMAVLSAGVVCAQTLQVSPTKLTPSGTPLQGASSDTINIWNGSSTSSTSYYTIVASIDTPSAWVLDSSVSGITWLAVSAASGSSATGVAYNAITVSYTTTNLPEGKYNGTITITQTNGTRTVKTVPVVLTVNQDENLGVALGPSSAATAASGIAVGSRTGRAVAVGANTIQIGAGVSSTAGTTYIRNYELLDSSGVIPAARLGGTLATTNQHFLSGTGVTSTLTIVNGIITGVTP